MDEPQDLTAEEDRHIRLLLARVSAGQMTIEEAALILQGAHPDLPGRVREIQQIQEAIGGEEQ